MKATQALKEKKIQEEKKKLKEKEEKEKQAKEAAKLADKQNRMKRIEGALPKVVKACYKYQKFLFFNKLKYYKREEILNETIILNETMYDSVVVGEQYLSNHPPPYK